MKSKKFISSHSENDALNRGSVEDVISGGYCVGCGACAVGDGAPVEVRFANGKYEASYTSNEEKCAARGICPFADEVSNEDEIAKARFKGLGLDYSSKLGYYDFLGAAYVSNVDRRLHSSSGGILTWVASRLLERGLVDGVIHVTSREPDERDQRLFHYSISRTTEEIASGASSRYYPVTIKDVMNEVQNENGRFAFVGLPCFVKAVNLLMQSSPLFRERIPYLLGLVCGHLKTAGFAELFAAQLGVGADDIADFNFRKKLQGQPANRYGVEVVQKSAGEKKVIVSPAFKLYGSDWGHSFFKLKGCDYCDDIFAETADFVVGDAWLPEYRNDWQGTSIIVNRNKEIAQLFSEAIAAGEIGFDELSERKLVASQRANFTHRRDTLWLRLRDADKKGEWRPRKRFEHCEHPTVSAERERITRIRVELGEFSQSAWLRCRGIRPMQDAVDLFRGKIQPLTDELSYLALVEQESARSLRARLHRLSAKVILRLVSTLVGTIRRVGKVERTATKVMVLPPSSPGSVGDDAVLRTVVTELQQFGTKRFVFLSYNHADDWSNLGVEIESLCIEDYLSYLSHKTALRILLACMRASRLVVCGTDVLDGHHSAMRSVRRYSLMKLVAAVGMPVRVIGASFSEEAAPSSRHALRRVASKVRLCARDEISWQVMRSVTGRDVDLVADPAFWLRPVRAAGLDESLVPWMRSQREEERVLLGLNINHFLCSSNTDDRGESLVQAFATLVNELLSERKSLAICLIPHDVRGNPSDADLAKAVHSLVDSSSADRCTLVPDGLTSAEIKEVASQLDVIFCGKMHLSIAALGSGVPVGCITYKDKKFLGLFAHFGIENWLLPEESWKIPGEMRSFVGRLIDSRDEIEQKITGQLPRVLALSKKNFVVAMQ